MATVIGGNNTAAVVPIPKVVSFTSVDVEAKIKWTLGISSEAKKLLKADLCHMDDQTGRLGSIHSVTDLLRLGSRLLKAVTTDEWTLLLKGPTKKSTSLSAQTLLRLGCLFVFRVKEVASLHLKDARKVEELMCVLASLFDFVFCQSMLHAVNTIPNNQLLLVNLTFHHLSFGTHQGTFIVKFSKNLNLVQRIRSRHQVKLRPPTVLPLIFQMVVWLLLNWCHLLLKVEERAYRRRWGKPSLHLGRCLARYICCIVCCLLMRAGNTSLERTRQSTTSLFHSLKTYWKTVLGLRLVSCDICVPFLSLIHI